MSREEIKETLEKQLQLLHERSAGCDSNYMALALLSKAMCEITERLIQISTSCL